MTDEPGQEPRREHLGERIGEELEELYEAAVEAELESGGREETEREAARHVAFRLARVGLGALVFLTGIALVVLPGPGLIVMAAGLALMAPDVPFAKRWLEKVRERIPEGGDGDVARWVIVVSVAGLVTSVTASVWWTFLR